MAITAGEAVGEISVGVEVEMGLSVEVEMGLSVEVADAANGMTEGLEDCWFVPEHPVTKKMMQMQIPISFWVIVELIFSSHETRLLRIYCRT